MADAFSSMAAALGGTAPPALPTRAEATTSRFSRAADALRKTDDPELAAMADGIERWLIDGGDLGKLLGAKGTRGEWHNLPAHAARKRTKHMAVSQALQILGLEAETPQQAAKCMAWMLARPLGTHVLREIGTDIPRSADQLTRIIRCM